MANPIQYGGITGSAGVRIPISGELKIGAKPFRELEFLPRSEFPGTGRIKVLYIDTTSNVLYYWDGAAYIQISGGSSESCIIVKTEAQWNALPTLISERGVFYVYSDHRQESGIDIPSVKIGDGLAYVVDLPFFDVGVTDADRARWDNKVSAKIDTLNTEMLVLYND